MTEEDAKYAAVDYFLRVEKGLYELFYKYKDNL